MVKSCHCIGLFIFIKLSHSCHSFINFYWVNLRSSQNYLILIISGKTKYSGKLIIQTGFFNLVKWSITMDYFDSNSLICQSKISCKIHGTYDRCYQLAVPKLHCLP